MIHSNVIIYENRPLDLKNRNAVPIIELPQAVYPENCDRGIIDQIRNQPKPNEISKHSISKFKTDIQQMVKLCGAYCKKNSINKIMDIIKEIHNTLNEKTPPEIKNWIRLLTGLHPEIDKQIKSLGYWKTPYSEVIGTNTILYYAGPESVDILNWGKDSKLNTNEIDMQQGDGPSYIRESTRQKLDSNVVELLQTSNHITAKYLSRNLIWESKVTTAKLTGAEDVQNRPIDSSDNHGASLNNDWANAKRSISCKSQCKQLAISHLQSNGSNVNCLVNHLTPLINQNKAQTVSARFKSPIGVEETFPRRVSKINPDFDNSGQRVLKTPTEINNDIFKLDVLQGE